VSYSTMVRTPETGDLRAKAHVEPPLHLQPSEQLPNTVLRPAWAGTPRSYHGATMRPCRRDHPVSRYRRTEAKLFSILLDSPAVRTEPHLACRGLLSLQPRLLYTTDTAPGHGTRPPPALRRGLPRRGGYSSSNHLFFASQEFRNSTYGALSQIAAKSARRILPKPTLSISILVRRIFA